MMSRFTDSLPMILGIKGITTGIEPGNQRREAFARETGEGGPRSGSDEGVAAAATLKERSIRLDRGVVVYADSGICSAVMRAFFAPSSGPSSHLLPRCGR